MLLEYLEANEMPAPPVGTDLVIAVWIVSEVLLPDARSAIHASHVRQVIVAVQTDLGVSAVHSVCYAQRA